MTKEESESVQGYDPTTCGINASLVGDIKEKGATVEIDLSQETNRTEKADEQIERQTREDLNEDWVDSKSDKDVKSPIKLILANKDDKNPNANGSKIPNGRRKSSTKSDSSPHVAKVGRMRHIIALLALASIVLANMNRQAYNQALVRMIRRRPKVIDTDLEPLMSNTIAPTVFNSTLAFNTKSISEIENSTILNVDSLLASTTTTAEATSTNNQTSSDVDREEEIEEGFDWTGAQIGLLQAAFSYGYTFFMIPGGRLSEIYGAKWVIFLSIFGSALCSIMTPLLAETNFELLVASRVFMGLCQTGISPALYALFSRWLPPDESSVYLPMIKVGVMIGFMSGSLINGFLAWKLVFYILGFLGLLSSVIWIIFVSSLPGEHRFISDNELKYIQHCLERRSKTSKKETSEKKKTSTSAPWLRILKNPIVLAFTFTKFTVKLSTDTQTMQIPMYLRNVFKISDELNGILNGANFAIQATFTGIVAYTAKEMVVNEQFGLHKTGIRRLFQGINCFGMSLSYLLISFNMSSLNLVCGAVILLSITSMFGAGGEAVLPIDLTTEYSASIMAIANSVANLSGIVLPPIVSFLLDNQLASSGHWNQVWWFISVVMACGGFMFTCLVKAKIQGFNEGKKRKRVKSRGEENGHENGKRKSEPTVSCVTIEMSPTTKTSRL